MSFVKQLKNRWIQSNRMLCIGLDSHIDKIPESLKSSATPLLDFNKQIIDATHDLVCAYKPQIAYYAAQGAEGELLKTIQYIHENYPAIPVILDAKRSDIGATSEMYAKECFERFQADAVTVNPYMGGDTIEPFLKYRDKGVVILCKTSNADSGEFQDLKCDGVPLYQIVAKKAATEWNKNGNVMLVVGATHPEQLGEVRKIVGEMPLLIPGIGAQGGSLKDVLTQGRTSDGYGLAINSARGIIYASAENDFAEAARRVAQEICDTIGLS